MPPLPNSPSLANSPRRSSHLYISYIAPMPMIKWFQRAYIKMNDWTSSYLPISHHVNLWAFRQGTTTILTASNTCRIRGHERWRRRWCFRSAWMGKVRGGEEASGLTRGAGYLFRRRVRDSSSQRFIGDGWGVTGERIVFAVGGRPQPWIEGPRLHGLEVAPPWWWYYVVIEKMCDLKLKLRRDYLFSNERPTVRQGLNYLWVNILFT